MKKIAIVSEFQINTVNYGNHLQAYALKKYLNDKFPSMHIDSLQVVPFAKKKQTFLIYNIYCRFIDLYTYMNNYEKDSLEKCRVEKRYKRFHDFALNYIVDVNDIKPWSVLKKSNYDMYIVGSDIVWRQRRGYVDRIKFLNFVNSKNAKKISYAASFGMDWIPKENKKVIKKYLDDFSAISVREKSSIQMLDDMGVQNVVNTCDPTLLLNRSDWIQLESALDIKEKYVFAYLLGDNEQQKKCIQELCKKENLILVTIPYSSGGYSAGTEDFADVQVLDCSPQEWIWLIHHAEYIITDSFHGIVFSTIFEKKFVAVNRIFDLDWNNRIVDYLRQIDQSDKLCELSDISHLSDMNWDYSIINARVKELIVFSKDFLWKEVNSI